MKNWILLIACLFTVGAQVCFGAERVGARKGTKSKDTHENKVRTGQSLRVDSTKKAKKGSEKWRKPTPGLKAGFFKQLKALEPAMAQMMIAVNPEVESAPAEQEAEKPRVALHASAVEPVEFVAQQQRDSLLPLREELAKVFSEVQELSSTRESSSAWSEVRTRAQSVAITTVGGDRSESQAKIDDFKQKLQERHSKHVARTRASTFAQ